MSCSYFSSLCYMCEKYISELQTELQDVVNVQDNEYPYRDFRSIAMKLCQAPQFYNSQLVTQTVHVAGHYRDIMYVFLC